MEIILTTQDKETIKKFLKPLFPNTSEFINYCLPYLKDYIIREKYENYLIILKKMDINGVEEMAGIFSSITDIFIENSMELMQGIFERMQQKYGSSNAIPNSMAVFLKEYTGEMSAEKMIPYMTKASDAMYEKYHEKLNSMEEKAAKLPKNEKSIYDYFGTLLTKLWIRYLLTNPKYSEQLMFIFIKDYLQSYHKGMEALYNIEILPKELLTYIESIEIPDEKKLRDSMENIQEEKTDVAQVTIPQVPIPQIPIPVFEQQEEIYALLQKYFDKSQHISLLSLIKSEISTEKLVFQSKGNQLADVFKKLYMANLIKGCNKQQLVDWICENFRYKNTMGVSESFDKKYLIQIISSEDRNCKDPIIEVKKDENGKVTFFQPNRNSGKYL